MAELANGGNPWGILGGLVAAQAKRAQNNKLAIDQQRADQENEDRKARTDIAQQQLKELQQQHATENAHNDLALKAAMSLQKVQQAKEQQEMVERSNASGVPIPGAAVNTPMASQPVPGAIGVQTPAQPGTQTLRGAGPNGEDLTLPFDPKAYAQHQQDIQELLKGPGSPEAKARIADYQTQYSLIGQNQKDLAQFQNQLPMTEYQKANIASEEKRAKDAKAAQMYDTNVQAGAHIRAAQISAGLEGGDAVDASAAPYIQQIQNGQLSMEDLNAMKLPKGIHNAVVSGVSTDGGVIPNKAELGAVQKYAPIAPLISAIDKYNDILKNSPTTAGIADFRIPGTVTYKAIQPLKDQIETQTPGIARSIGTETGRLSNQQIQMSQDLTNPDKGILSGDPAIRQKQRDILLQLGNSAIDANLSRLPASQAASIKAKTGLTAIPYGQQSTQQPTVQQPTNQQRPSQPQGPTHIWTPNGVQPVQPQGNQ